MLFTVILYLLNVIAIMSIIFFRKKDISVTFAWLLVLIFLPVIGFLLYFFFGSTKKLEIMTKKYQLSGYETKYDANLEKSFSDLGEKHHLVNEDVKKYESMIHLNTTNARCFYTDNNNAELLINGQNKFPRLFKDVENAKSSIHVMYFIFKSKDPIGKEFINLLAKKAAEGVEVKVMYDRLGALSTKYADFKPIIDNGGKIQQFMPSMIKTLICANYRFHRKMVIVDGQICITGGINVGDDYLGLYPKLSPWRDTSIRLTGSAVNELQLVFFRDWIFCLKQNKKVKQNMVLTDLEANKHKYFPNPLEQGNMGMQIIDFSPDQKYATHKDSYVKLCTDAKDYLYIQTPYFVPDQTLLDAIRMAAQSGVDTRMMLPGIPDKKFVYYVAMSYVEELLEAGVKLYAHKGFLHAKTVVIDDYVTSVGTTNFDIRSFRLDYEVNTLIYDNGFAKTAKETFLQDIEDCTEFDLKKFKRRSNKDKILESIFRFAAPLS